MTSLLTRITEFWTASEKAGVVAPGPLVVGVSGGPDSLALFHLLRRLAPERGLRLHVAHLDHGWRGAAGQADADFVAATCAAWDVPCTCGAWDVPAYARRVGLSPEEAARRVRYTFLAGVAAAVGAAQVAVGHNADDQAETVLAHWLRGAGLRGLAGMAGWAPLPLPPDAPALAAALGVRLAESPLWLVRPLLGVWRNEIAAYCAQEGLTPREDASNADPTYQRNHLRHTLLPLLEQEQPGLARRLWENAAVFRDEDAALEANLDRAWSVLAEVTRSGVALCLAAFAALPPALQRRALRRAAQLVAGDLQGLTGAHIREALALLGPTGATGATLDWPGEIRVRREKERAFVERAKQAVQDDRWPCLTPGEVRQLPAAGAIALSAWTLTIAGLPGPATGGVVPEYGPWQAAFAAEDLMGAQEGGLLLRTRRPGDRIRPLGAGGHSRKLQDVLVDGGVPRHLRDTLTLLAQENGAILWVPGPGGRRSDLAPITPATRQIVEFTFTRVP